MTSAGRSRATITRRECALRVWVLAAFAGIAAGCGSAPHSNAKLEQARAAYEAARNDAAAADAAPVVLDKAQSELERAISLLEDGEGAELIDHHAYLAQRYSAIAVARGRTAVAELQVADAEARRQEVLLEARTREAGQAELRAESRELEAAAAEAQAARRQTESEGLKSRLQELQAEPTERGMVLTLSDVLFDTAEAELKPGSTRALEQLVDFMNRYPDRNLMIEGFTDSSGAETFNQALSERRANAVESALIADGIDQSRMRSRGYGENYPVASNGTEAGRQRNRRVEVVISDEAGNIPERLAESS
ncbi:MAG: OmpA family protein [Gammaproteobacteria bacterium]